MFFKKLQDKVESPAFLRNFGGDAKAVAISPDGRLLCCAKYSEGSVELWDVPKKERLSKIATFGQYVSFSSIVFRSDSKLLAIASSGEGMLVHDCQTGTSNAIHRPAHFLSVAFDPHGDLLAVHFDRKKGGVTLSRVPEGGQVLEVECGPAPTAKLARNGELLAVAGEGDPKLKVYDCHSGKQLAEFPWTKNVRHKALGVSPDGRYLAYKLGEWHQISVFDVTTARECRKLYLESSYNRLGDLVFSDDSRFLAGCQRNNLLLWDLNAILPLPACSQEEYIFEWVSHKADCVSCAFCGPSSLLAIGWGDLDDPYSVELWDISRVLKADPGYWQRSGYFIGQSLRIGAAHWQPSPLEIEHRIKLPMFLSGITFAESAEITHGTRLSS